MTPIDVLRKSFHSLYGGGEAVKLSLCSRRIGGVEIKLDAFLTSTVGGLASRSVHFIPRGTSLVRISQDSGWT